MSLVAGFEAVIEGAGKLGLRADADDLVGRLDPRPGQLRSFLQLDDEFHIHRRLDAGPRRLAVGLKGMAVADEEQTAGVIDRQIDRRTLADLVVIEVPAVGSRRSGRRREIARGRDADTAEHRPGGELQRMNLALGRSEPDGIRLSVDIPGHECRCAP